VDVDDPVGAFYRRYELGPLYGRPLADLSIGAPAGSADVDQLDALTNPTPGPLPAYLGGTIDAEGVDDDTWVVVAIDGVVQGFSQLFPMVDTDRAFSVLLAQDVVADGEPHVIDVYVTDGPNEELRPLEVS